jgi:hypothetical protein
MQDIHPSDHDHLIRKRKASLAGPLLISEPVRHQDDLASSEEQEDKQHAEVEASVESCRQNVIPPRPKRVPVTIRPEHHHKSSNQTASHSCADIAPEMRHCAEKDRCVPELEFGARELAVEGVDHKGSNCAQDEAEWQAMIDMLFEQATWSLCWC